jgi:hypothetical protein
MVLAVVVIVGGIAYGQTRLGHAGFPIWHDLPVHSVALDELGGTDAHTLVHDRLAGADGGAALSCMADMVCGPVAPAQAVADGLRASGETPTDTGDEAAAPSAVGGAAPDAGGDGGGATHPADAELTQGAFLSGYDAASGPGEYREHIIAVVNCESTWDSGAVSDAGQLGLLQFEPSTWASYARSDMVWTDPYAQGWTGANLIGDLLDRGISPGSSAGWEWCWWR